MSHDDDASADLSALAGYRVEPGTGALLTLPWPDNPNELPPSLFPAIERWASKYLKHHLTGRPWRYTRDQRRYLYLWYSLTLPTDDDQGGRWNYTSGCFRRSKGAGKDPMNASHRLVELAGPCRFGGWTRDGHGELVPIAVPAGMPLVQVAANSEAQARDVIAVAVEMITPAFARDYRIDPGVTQINAKKTGGRIETLTASVRTAEGDPASDIGLNESHHMTSESGGTRLAEVARRNAAKSPMGLARISEYTNAHAPGMDSVAELTYLTWRAQVSESVDLGLLYDSREWPIETRLDDDESLMQGLAAAYHDAPWVDLSRLATEVRDPRTPAADSRRFYGNQITVPEDALLDPEWIRAALRTNRTPVTRPLADGDEVVLFGDGSKSDDDTGVVAVRLTDGYAEVVAHEHPTTNHPLVDRLRVDALVSEAHERFKVRAFFFDPSHAKDDDTPSEDNRYWWPYCDEWMHRWGKRYKVWAIQTGPRRHAVAFDMSTPQAQMMFTPFVQQTIDDFENGEIVISGNAALTDHLANARDRYNKYGRSLSKESRESKKKMDLAVCLVGARMLWRQLAISQVGKRQRAAPSQGRVIVFD